MIGRLLRVGEGRTLRRLVNIARQTNEWESELTVLSDDELRALTEELRERVTQGESPEELMPEAFALVREGATRVLGQRHYDVQIMGGAALYLGNIAEMKTGEGKTLVATLAAYLGALSGTGVHVVTVNDYLARRDAENMGRLYRFLGMTVGVIVSDLTPEQRREAYACDITYGTNNEFGFDYLRDNMAQDPADLVQRGHHFAIVDEVDSILIDEARTPLIISGPAEGSAKWYPEFARIADHLQKGEHYDVDEGKHTVSLYETAMEYVEDQLGIENLYESANTPLVGYLNNAVKAKELYRLDHEYVVSDLGKGPEVLIVDEFTGRVLPGRRFNEGIHQALEAKEGVEIQAENQTLATVTLQNYFRLYDKLGGMTGTAMTEAAEFDQTYKLGVVEIPTNRPVQRLDLPDAVYTTETGKFNAVVEDLAQRFETGQPVLVGTVSVEKSETISRLLTQRGIKHEVLNAKQNAREAAIVAQAGRKGAITVATNMAGRGTDILLGGNPEALASDRLHAQGINPLDFPTEWEQAYPMALEKAKAQVAGERDEVIAAGGLYVLGTERHESRRIDNQLRGRAARQGDPGESKFYLSAGDDLLRKFNAGRFEAIMTRLNVPDDQPMENKLVTRAILSAQTQIEAQNFEIRKDVLKYDEVLNLQRKVIYEERLRVLHGEDLHEQVLHFLDDTIEAYVWGATQASEYAEEWDLPAMLAALKLLYPVGISLDALEDEELASLNREYLIEEFCADARAAYQRREEELGLGPDGEPLLRELERRVLLSVVDRKWREHLYEMDYLKEGIGLRAMAQRDPLVEYRREAFDMFAAMSEAVKEEAVGFVFNVEVTLPVAVDEDSPSEPSGDESGPALLAAMDTVATLQGAAPASETLNDPAQDPEHSAPVTDAPSEAASEPAPPEPAKRAFLPAPASGSDAPPAALSREELLARAASLSLAAPLSAPLAPSEPLPVEAEPSEPALASAPAESATEPGPAFAEPEPAERPGVEPTEVEPAEPTEAEPAEPTEAEPAEPTEVEPAEPTEAEPAEPTEVEPAEPAAVASWLETLGARHGARKVSLHHEPGSAAAWSVWVEQPGAAPLVLGPVARLSELDKLVERAEPTAQ